jgi:transcriptional antiterminator RfaH
MTVLDANDEKARQDAGETVNGDEWYAVFCRPRQERRAVWNLRNQGFVVLCPRMRRRVRKGTAWQNRVEPMFPRYAFVQPRESGDLGRIRSTRGAIGLVGFGNHFPCVPQEVIEAIAAQIGPDECLLDGPSDTLKPGDPVCIVDGPFTGALARFAGKGGEGRVAVLLEIMQRESRVELNPGALQKA